MFDSGLDEGAAGRARPPDAALVAQLDRPPDPADDHGCLERIGAWERVIAHAQAAQAEEIAAFVDRAEYRMVALRAEHDPARDGPLGVLDTPGHAIESATAEVRLMLRLTTSATYTRVGEARSLQRLLPTASLARSGLLSWPKVRVLLDGADALSDEQVESLQRAVLPKAPDQTTGQLRAAVRRFLLRLEDHDLATRRRERRERGRAVVLQSESDGMATLRVFLPAAAGTGIFAVLDEHARHCPSSDPRTMDHRRTDALTDLVLRDTGLVSSGTAGVVGGAAGTVGDAGPAPERSAPEGSTPTDAARTASAESLSELPPGLAPAPPGGSPFVGNRVRIQIRVTVPLDTLVGTADEPADLAGFGPIPAPDARALAFDPSSVWYRLVTDPVSGAVLDHGTTRYRPPRALSRFVRSRWATCDHPGCRIPAHRCDVDHTVPHDPVAGAGPTSAANTAPRCRPHHRLKSMRGWSVTQRPNGTSVWRTPSGHVYVSEPGPVGPTAPADRLGGPRTGRGLRDLLVDPSAAGRLAATMADPAPF